MLHRKSFSVTAVLANIAWVVALVAASALVPTRICAAAPATVVPTVQTNPSLPLGTMPKFPPRRAPLAPPAVNDVSRAYAFRTQLLGSPQCQRFATESDSVFLDGTLDDAQKTAKLKALGAEAKASDCLTPAAY